ncbi:hypothetical protein I79_004293 [Cricetulus griseus]|uniref:Uncharacterized protein n=1 Tax=Cricetulus griseus TaxID=10029 RepID=G3H248_CRIGR|nr:hypothetical protein I79_004293 [Cricetulus griseus]
MGGKKFSLSGLAPSPSVILGDRSALFRDPELPQPHQRWQSSHLQSVLFFL